MNLFELKEHRVTFSPQALLLKPFKALWDRDKSKLKDKAKFELGYVWFMEDYKSDFVDIIDPEERSEHVLKALNTPKGWKPDNVVDKARAFYKEFYDYYVSYQALNDAKMTLRKVSQFISQADPAERNNSGGLVFDVKKLADTAKQIPDMLDTIKKCEAELKKDMQVDSGTRGQKDKAIFEEGI